MANIKRLLTVFLLFSSSLTFAGYAQLKPPTGWSAGMGAAIPGTPGTFNFGAAANGATFKGSTVLTNASLNVAGQLVTVPVSMRVAANAAQVAAAYSFGNPAIFLGTLAASALYQVYKSSDLEATPDGWVKSSSTMSYRYSYEQFTSEYGADVAQFLCSKVGTASCQSPATVSCGSGNPFNCTTVDMWNGTRNHTLTRQGIAGPLTKAPATINDFPVPVDLPEETVRYWPKEFPPLPVQFPVINPDPATIPTTYPSPSSPPAANPLNIPTGNPVPTGDPDVFNQPVLHVIPSSTASDPWRVDVQPLNIPQPTATPKTPQQLNPPVSEPSSPAPTPGLCELYPNILACAPASTIQDKLDFCKSNPDVIACQKIENVQSDDLQTKNISSLITPDSGWGSDNASCPAARKLSIPGAEFSFQMMCDFSSGIRPIILALAWLSAAFILLGMRGSE